MNQSWSIDPRIIQAAIAGAFVAVGWLINGWQNRRVAAAGRAERLRDVHRALYAEIASYLTNLGSAQALYRYRDKIVARMEADPDYVPLIPTERNDVIFRALLENIHILPRTSIDPVVSYYNQLFAIEAMIEDMRGQRFPTLEPERRIAMYKDYIALKAQAFEDGSYALAMITAYAEGGRKAALAEEEAMAAATAKPSSPDADPSGRSQG